MIKGSIIVILVLLVIGLYYAPDITKKVMQATGHATIDSTKKALKEFKENDEIKNVTKEIKNDVSKKIDESLMLKKNSSLARRR